VAQVLKAATPENTPGGDPAKVTEIVSGIIDDVRSEGDAAVRRWSEKLDSWSPESFRLGPDEISKIVKSLPTTVIEDIEFVQAQVRRFAQAQLASMSEF
jgi:sulfopropanediol 3-dehydrogenase